MSDEKGALSQHHPKKQLHNPVLRAVSHVSASSAGQLRLAGGSALQVHVPAHPAATRAGLSRVDVRQVESSVPCLSRGPAEYALQAPPVGGRRLR